MKVLISNDDGPPSLEESPFILPFIKHLENLGWYVKVCLPDSQKSWIAKSFLIKQEIQVRYFNRKTNQICNEQHNENDFVLASTIGAAMEAVLNKRKAVSVSFCFYNQRLECIQNCCETAIDIINHLFKKDLPWPENGMFNINIPMLDYKCPVHLTEFHKASYGSLFEKLKGEPAKFKFSPDFTAINSDKDGLPGTDKWALMNKCVSVTPMVAAFQTVSTVNDYNFDSINEKYAAATK